MYCQYLYIFELSAVNSLIYLVPFAGNDVGGFGEVPLFLVKTGERFADRLSLKFPTSFSGDGEDPPPVAEFRREADSRTVVSRCRNLFLKKILKYFR